MCAAWDGEEWVELDEGLFGQQDIYPSRVYNIIIYDGELYAGGIFHYGGQMNGQVNNIAKLEDGSWRNLGVGLSFHCFTMSVYNGNLTVCGQFRTAGDIEVLGMANWTGTQWEAFEPMGMGLNLPIYCLEKFGESLVVAGDFTDAGGVPAHNIAEYDGVSWHSMGTGLYPGNEWKPYRDMIVFNSQLIVAGSITNAGGTPVTNIARWDGMSWHTMGEGIEQTVNSMVVYNGELFADANRWSDTSWVSELQIDGEVLSHTVYDNYLVVGGDFDYAGGINVNNIVLWDGNNYYSLGQGLDDGFNMGKVMALAVYSDELIAGGAITTGGNFISRWDGENWLPLGSGVNTWVTEINAHSDYLFVGGRFTYAGGLRANRIAYWDGVNWSPMGSGLSGSALYNLEIYGIKFYQNSLFIGGDFTVAGNKHSWFIGRWKNPDILPIYFRQFKANRINTSVLLRWEVSNGGEIAEFRIWRSRAGEPRNIIGLQMENGGNEYEYYDYTASPEEQEYWIQGINMNGEEYWCGPQKVLPANGVLVQLQLSQGYPNPLKSETTFDYNISHSGHVRIAIYDARGELVALLLDEYSHEGVGSVRWDGKNGKGAATASGVYFARLETINGVRTQKLIIAK